MTKEEAWKDLLDNWCSGCEECQFEGDGSCAPYIADTYAVRLFNAALATANQWTYLPELPKKTGWYLVTTTKTGTRTVNEALFKDGKLLGNYILDSRT